MLKSRLNAMNMVTDTGSIPNRRWPALAEQQGISRIFQLESGLPVIVSVLDGTHIRLRYTSTGIKMIETLDISATILKENFKHLKL
ncbi:hypothetical protein KUTeg_012683, partial [Tegillarca granosa]